MQVDFHLRAGISALTTDHNRLAGCITGTIDPHAHSGRTALIGATLAIVGVTVVTSVVAAVVIVVVIGRRILRIAFFTVVGIFILGVDDFAAVFVDLDFDTPAGIGVRDRAN